MNDQDKTKDQLISELEKRVEDRTAELAEANRKLVTTLESITDGFMAFDREWRFTYVNGAAAQYLRKSREELLGKVCWDLLPEASRLKFHAEFSRAVRENEPVHFGEFYPEPMNVWYDCHCYPSSDGLSVYFRDATSRKWAEEALRDSEEKYRTLVEASPDAVVKSDLTGNVVFASQKAAELLGFDSVEEVCTKKTVEFVVEEERPRLVANLSDLFKTGSRRGTEYTGIRKDGTRFPVEVSSVVIRDAAGKPKAVMAVVRDIAERKRAQSDLERERRTLFHMLRASDHERQVISYDIHDGLAQQLASAIMQFQAYDGLKEHDPGQARIVYDAAMQMLRHAHSEARRLISGVRPPILDEAGITAAVAHLVYDHSSPGGPRVEFHSGVKLRRLAQVLENGIYRIAQEALANALKHSGSENVKVSLVQDNSDLRLEVQDWGVGFDPQSVDDDRFGLEGIRERTRLLGGEFSIESEPGKGTRVRVTLPILEQEQG